MTITLPVTFGSHVPQTQSVTNDGRAADYAGVANRAWDKPGRAQYIGLPIVTKTITAENQWTTGSYFSTARDDPRPGIINLSITGTFTATVTLQRSFDDGDTWQDVEEFTEPVEKDVQNPNWGVKWRLGVDTGDFTSGPLAVRLSQV